MATSVSFNGSAKVLRQRQTANGNFSKFVITEAGKEADKRLDRHERLGNCTGRTFL
jgi:delta24(24(1))-sterol reductase